MRGSLLIALWLLVTTAASAEETLRFGSFAESGLVGWTEKVFQGRTEYRIVEDGGEKVLQARSQGTASGLVFETAYDPADYPILTWRWKIANIIASGDSRSKTGDDYAARLYVIFPHWLFFKTRTLNYIWANRLPREAVQANAYTGNAMMIAVESGAGQAGEWRQVRRDILADYRRAFGEEPPRVGAIAVMTDTDNTGETAVAWYGDIAASRR